MALLIGFGAAAVNPYLALETIDDMIANGQLEGISPRQAMRNYIKAACKGVLKVMSKMGISTIASYTGAQVFEAIGLDHEVVDEYFTGTTSRIGGVGLDVLAAEVAARHRLAHLDAPDASSPTASSRSAASTSGAARGRTTSSTRGRSSSSSTPRRAKRYEIFKEYTSAVDDQSEPLATLRGLLRLARRRGRARSRSTRSSRRARS